MANAESVDVPLTGRMTVADLRRQLAMQIPAAQVLIARSAFAVNSDYAAENHIVDATDDVAIIPPVSGG